MRSVVRCSMGLVALAAAALSYQSLMHLGVLAGYGNLAILYPLVVDAGAAASCAAWLHTRGRQPLVMTWCLLAVSVVLNGTTHYLESTHTAPSWLLVVAVAAVPPTVLGLCVHLAVGMGASPCASSDAHGDPAPSERVTFPPMGDDGPGRASDPGDENRVESTLIDPVAELIAAGASRRRVAAELGITEYRAKQLIAASRNGDGRVQA